MNPQRRLEILEAFASSKAREFDGFVIQWVEQHPEPVESLSVTPTEPEVSIPKRIRKPKVTEQTDITEPVTEE
jgi:hypothetical protein